MNRYSILFASILITICVDFGATRLKASCINPEDKPISVTIQTDIYKIFQNSCIDCHAIGGRKMAMSHINFSEWDNYPPEKKAVKANDIVKMLQKGKMPPKLYRESHPESVPTQDQIDRIVKWADSLPKK